MSAASANPIRTWRKEKNKQPPKPLAQCSRIAMRDANDEARALDGSSDVSVAFPPPPNLLASSAASAPRSALYRPFNLWSRSLLAGSPVDVDLLGESNGGIIVGDLADGGAVGAGERNAVVDVEDAVGAAGREDVARGGDLVRLGVHLALRPDAAARDGRLRGRGCRSVLAEVVRAIEGSGDALVQLGIAVVRALDNGELEPAGVLQDGLSALRSVAGERSKHTLRFR